MRQALRQTLAVWTDPDVGLARRNAVEAGAALEGFEGVGHEDPGVGEGGDPDTGSREPGEVAAVVCGEAVPFDLDVTLYPTAVLGR